MPASSAARRASVAQVRVVGPRHVGEAQADRVVVRPGQRARAGEVQVILDQHDLAGLRTRDRARPAALVTTSRSAPEPPQQAHGERDVRGRPALVEMQPALHQRHPPAVQPADHQPPGMPRRGGDRKAGDLAIGDRDRRLDRLGEPAEAGAQDQRQLHRRPGPPGDRGRAPPPAAPLHHAEAGGDARRQRRHRVERLARGRCAVSTPSRTTCRPPTKTWRTSDLAVEKTRCVSRVEERHGVRAPEVDQDHVGELARPRATRAGPPRRAPPPRRASPCAAPAASSPPSASSRAPRCSVAASRSAIHMSRSLPEIAPSVPTRDPHAGLQHVGHPGDAARELEVRHRVVRDASRRCAPGSRSPRRRARRNGRARCARRAARARRGGGSPSGRSARSPSPARRGSPRRGCEKSPPRSAASRLRRLQALRPDGVGAMRESSPAARPRRRRTRRRRPRRRPSAPATSCRRRRGRRRRCRRWRPAGRPPAPPRPSRAGARTCPSPWSRRRAAARRSRASRRAAPCRGSRIAPSAFHTCRSHGSSGRSSTRPAEQAVGGMAVGVDRAPASGSCRAASITSRASVPISAAAPMRAIRPAVDRHRAVADHRALRVRRDHQRVGDDQIVGQGGSPSRLAKGSHARRRPVNRPERKERARRMAR